MKLITHDEVTRFDGTQLPHVVAPGTSPSTVPNPAPGPPTCTCIQLWARYFQQQAALHYLSYR